MIDIEVERARFEVWRSDGNKLRDEYLFAKDSAGNYVTKAMRGQLAIWLAAKRDAEVPDDAIAVLINHCVDDPLHGNVTVILAWLKANYPEAYEAVTQRDADKGEG